MFSLMSFTRICVNVIDFKLNVCHKYEFIPENTLKKTILRNIFIVSC